MKPQLILAVSAAGLLQQLQLGHGLTPFALHQMRCILEDAGLFLGPRDMLEKDTTFLQIIPYVVLRQGGKVVRYLRTPEGQEPELHGKVSVGAGGHIDMLDVAVLPDSTIDVETTLHFSAIREITEEFGLSLVRSDLKWIGLLADFSDKVGKVHLGVVCVYDLPDDFEVKSKEASQADVKLCTLAELEGERPRMEKWSAHVLDYLQNIAAKR